MPRYEYVCLECDHMFEKILTLAEHEEGAKIICPKCGSNHVEQEAAAFFAVTSKKS